MTTTKPTHRDLAFGQCIELFRCLFDVSADTIAFCAIDVGWTRYATAETCDEVLQDLWQRNAKSNVYFMANAGDGAGTKIPNVLFARCLFVDFDRSLSGESGVTVEEALQRIEEANLPIPTAVVHSGRGVHAYWRLSEPMSDLVEWRGRQRALIRLLDSDGAIHNPNRLMRLPGFRNHNHPDKPLARLVEANADRVYDLIEFPQAIAEPRIVPGSVVAGSLSRFSRRFLDEGWIMHHGRRQTMFTVACDMAARGWDEDSARTAIMTRMVKLSLSESELADCPRQIRNAFALPRTPIADAAGDDDETEIPRDHETDAGPDCGMTAAELVRAYPVLRPEVVKGLLREGETMNIIAPPKTGKSWLVIDLALSIAAGVPWLDTFDTVAGDVIVLDNEIHPETMSFRYRRIIEESQSIIRSGNVDHRRRGYTPEAMDRIRVHSFRGKLRDLCSLGPWVRSHPKGRFKVVVLDAFYRFMPRDWDENDNGTMASVYNLLDSYAAHLGAAVVCIHHSSKGSQSGKSVTDVGSGAGAQSRAVDTHLVLRQHEQDRVVVVDAVARSFPPIEPRCFRWSFPFWESAPDCDPRDLKQDKPKRRLKAARADDADDDDTKPLDSWTVARLASFIPPGEWTKEDIRGFASDAGLESDRLFRTLWSSLAPELRSRREGKSGKVFYSKDGLS